MGSGITALMVSILMLLILNWLTIPMYITIPCLGITMQVIHHKIIHGLLANDRIKVFYLFLTKKQKNVEKEELALYEGL